MPEAELLDWWLCQQYIEIRSQTGKWSQMFWNWMFSLICSFCELCSLYVCYAICNTYVVLWCLLYKQENKISRSGAWISIKIFRDIFLLHTLIIICLNCIKKLLVPKTTIFVAIMKIYIKINLCFSRKADRMYINEIQMWHEVETEYAYMYMYSGGGVVVKILHYKPAGRGFDSRWCDWNFSVT